MSFSSLKEYWAFTIIERLVNAATSSDNDRPPWTVPKTDEDWKIMEYRFELFRKIAPVLVEMKLLAR